MKADLVTIFPDFFRGPIDYGITRRAQELGLAEIQVHDLRKFTHDRHRTVDDRPFGGGEGMVLKPEPIFECIEAMGIVPRDQRVAAKQSVVLLSAQGKKFDQNLAGGLAGLEQLVLICGRYEGERPGLPCLMLGSHYDTVRDAGKWDGPLGLITAISCVADLNRRGRRFPFAIEVTGFAVMPQGMIRLKKLRSVFTLRAKP